MHIILALLARIPSYVNVINDIDLVVGFHFFWTNGESLSRN